MSNKIPEYSAEEESCGALSEDPPADKPQPELVIEEVTKTPPSLTETEKSIFTKKMHDVRQSSSEYSSELPGQDVNQLAKKKTVPLSFDDS